MKPKFKAYLKTTPFIIGVVMSAVGMMCLGASCNMTIIADKIYLREGFFPLICSGLLLLFSVMYIIQQYKEFDFVPVEDGTAAREERHKGFLWVVVMPLSLAVAAYLMKYLGTYVIIVLILFIWFKFFSKFSWLKSVILTAIYIAILYFVFSYWLMVPFPTFLGLGYI